MPAIFMNVQTYGFSSTIYLLPSSQQSRSDSHSRRKHRSQKEAFDVVFRNRKLLTKTICHARQISKSKRQYPKLQARKGECKRLWPTTIDEDVAVRVRLRRENSEGSLCERHLSVNLSNTLTVAVRTIASLTRKPHIEWGIAYWPLRKQARNQQAGDRQHRRPLDDLKEHLNSTITRSLHDEYWATVSAKVSVPSRSNVCTKLKSIQCHADVGQQSCRCTQVGRDPLGRQYIWGLYNVVQIWSER